MKEKILNVLKQKSDYVSGQELADMFGVSRTAVWKAVTALKKEGYVIESVSRHGYRLNELNDTLNERELDFYENVYFWDTLDSTNDRAKRIALDGCPEFSIVTCNEQEGGKGRLGRSWSSPYGVNIYMSMVLFPVMEVSKTPQITLVVGLAAVKTIKDITKLDALIKWPNDIIINRKKVVGILTEMQAEIGRILFVVTGIGINVNQTEFDEDIRQKATSLCLESGKNYKRSEIIKQLAENIKQYYNIFISSGFAALKDEYEKMCINIGRNVRAQHSGNVVKGKAIGISDNGELIICADEGSIVNISCGEASVRTPDNKYI